MKAIKWKMFYTSNRCLLRIFTKEACYDDREEHLKLENLDRPEELG
ncbi:hypothetical protein HMPREF3187_00387 [Aerococcus christensenii]|uniref:Uncharacterized protein n=1 Tax=Aerococcus christensenii TaxID=87541 RepID=A0A133Y3Q1_9LACT|nr:hypothetical protein HMPREF3187_00387 [Aerococcus christensenii]